MSSTDPTISLQTGLIALRLDPDAGVITRLLAYLDLLKKWNAAINLTAIRDPQQMLVQHLLDSLSIVRPLESRLRMPSPRVLDVGSGGGLPGIVLSIVHPDWEVTCVDAVNKKVTFIRQVAAELRLANLHGEHSRVEEFKPTPRPGTASAPFDLITSRAFASLHDFTRLTAHLSSASEEAATVWAAMKGKVPTAEIDELQPPFNVFHVEHLQVPEMQADRCLIWISDRPTL
ncbi:MAG: rRNA ((527)-N(7))-methyltransferase RsmG [Rhizobacter sp.]|nr:rRNA ((527)-N(7))-methyltransferase RsmG [Rhizobacter sp.]